VVQLWTNATVFVLGSTLKKGEAWFDLSGALTRCDGKEDTKANGNHTT